MERLPPIADPPVTPSTERVISPQIPQGPAFSEVLTRVSGELQSGQRLMDRVLSVRGQLSPQELLLLQAGIYRYSETVEVAAKLVDKLSNAVRTTMQSQ